MVWKNSIASLSTVNVGTLETGSIATLYLASKEGKSHKF